MYIYLHVYFCVFGYTLKHKISTYSCFVWICKVFMLNIITCIDFIYEYVFSTSILYVSVSKCTKMICVCNMQTNIAICKYLWTQMISFYNRLLMHASACSYTLFTWREMCLCLLSVFYLRGRLRVLKFLKIITCFCDQSLNCDEKSV